MDINTADMQYRNGEYFEAQKTYRKVYNSIKKKDKRKEKAYAAFQLGNCYSNLNQPVRAANAYLNAVRYGFQDTTVYLSLGKAYLKQGKYKEAEKYISQYLTYNPKSQEAIIAFENALNGQNITSRTRYRINEAKFINGRRSDYAPMFASKDYDVLYFTTTNEQSSGSKRSEVTGTKNGDIWTTRKNEHGKWMAPEPLHGNINSEFDEGIITFTSDGTTMYLTRAVNSGEKDTKIEIWTSRRSNAQWSDPVKFEFGQDTLYNYGHPALSPDDKYLYMTSDRPGGYGGYDIWRLNLKEKGAQLENMGPEINTSGNEMFPYVRNDSTLYFSSDGHHGFGGLDIYQASLTSFFTWSVTNMGQPVNSSYDDFGITFANGNHGYFSSNRGDERGYDHIYSFELPDIDLTVTGYVMDPEEYIIPNAFVRIIGDDGSNRRERIKDDGSFKFNIENGVNYILQASAEGYLNANQHFYSDMDETDAQYMVDFTLAPVNKPIVLDNIFYDFNKATLRPESKTALDSLVDILNQFPNITVELSSHTDRIGSDRYNNDLSQQRALSVVRYLVDIGRINPKRLTYKGYGKTMPMKITPRLSKLYPEFEEGIVLTPDFIENLEDSQLQENADQINRRTEFTITSVDFFLY